MFDRLEDLVRRLEELNIELTEPDTINNRGEIPPAYEGTE